MGDKVATGVVSPSSGRVQVRDTSTGQVSYVDKGSDVEAEAVERASAGTKAAVDAGAASPGAAKRIATPIDKLTVEPPITAPPVAPSAVQEFAREHGLSEKAAAETIARFQADPKAREFKPLPAADRSSLETVAGTTAPGIVAVKDFRGDFVYLKPDEAKKISTLTGPQLFEAQKEFKIIDPKAVLLPPEKIKAITRSREAAARTLNKYMDKHGEIDVFAAANAVRLGVKGVRQALIDVGYKPSDIKGVVKQVTENITIGGMMMPIKDWNNIPGKYQSIAIKENSFDKMNKAINADRKEFETTLKRDFPELHTILKEKGEKAFGVEVDRLQKKYDEHVANLAILEPFKGHPTMKHEYPFGGAPFESYETALPSYDLVKAIKAGRIKEVKEQFPESAVKEAQAIIDAEEKAATLDVARYGEQLWRSRRTGEIITSVEYRALGTSIKRDEFRKEQPALILAVDPKWQELKDKPKDNPERKAYEEQWKQKVIDTAMFAAFAASPYIPGAIGAVGMRVLPPAFSGATKAASFITTGGTTLAKLPIISAIPKVATQIVVGLTKLAITPAPAVYLTARTVDESNVRQLQSNWQAFEALSPPEKDAWAKKAGYTSSEGLTDPQKAVVLINYSAPSKKALDTWLEGIGAGTEKMNELANKGANWLDKNAPAPLVAPAKVAGGVGFLALGAVEGLMYVSALPVLAAGIVDKVPSGEVKAFAGTMALGMASFFGSIPGLIRTAPGRQIPRFVGLFILSPKAMIKLGKGLGYTLSPTTIKGLGRAIAIEFSTLRVPRLGQATQAQMLKMMTSIVKQLAEGKKVVTAKLGNFTVKVRNVPYQIAKPGRYWHFTTDITNFPAGQSAKIGAKRLYLSPQAAERFAVLSAAGKPMKHPGLVELGTSKKYQPELHKLLGKGEAELEAAIRNRTLDYVGKRTGFSATLGRYPIRQYVLRGDVVDPKALKLSFTEFLKVEALVAREIALDFALGWGKRMERAKQLFAKDPRIKRIDEAIVELKSSTPETIGRHGEIIEPRQSVAHPSGRGRIKPRVTAVVRNSKGEIMLVKDVTEKHFGLPGGQVDVKYKPGQLGFKKLPDGRHVLTPEGAAHGQVKSEVGIGLTKTKYAGTYLGKVNEYALAGSRIYEALAKTDKFKLKKSEIKDALWWDGKSEVTVFPATFDILKGLAKRYNLDMSKVKIDKSSSILNKARDTGIVKRLRENKPLSEVDISKINKTEIASLNRQKANIVRGKEPELADYFTSEPDWRMLSEFIMGRQRAVVVKQGRITPDAIKALQEHPELFTKEAQSLIKKQRRGEVLSNKELARYRKAIDRVFEAQQKKLQDVFDEASGYSKRNYPYQYSRAYANLMRLIIAGIAQRRAGVTPEEYTRTVLGGERREIPKLEQRTELAIKKEFRAPPVPEARVERMNLPTRHVPTRITDIPGRVPVPEPPTGYPPLPPATPPTIPPYKPPTKPPYKPPDKPPYVPPRPPTKPPILLLPKGATDEEKRKVISDSKGAIAWRQGQLGGKDVWHTIKYPYESEADYLTVLGRKPSHTTIVKGPGSAYQTARLRFGKPPARKLTGDIGFMDFFIEPKTSRRIGIGFTPDPKGLTTGDITIGISKTKPPITERPPRLSGRGKIRITPKRPRLRR